MRIGKKKHCQCEFLNVKHNIIQTKNNSRTNGWNKKNYEACEMSYTIQVQGNICCMVKIVLVFVLMSLVGMVCGLNIFSDSKTEE